ncbi:MAG: alpha/beta hydrolase [Flavobacteriales bacterium]|nr:alpha/beta hydrolase [Flavobacteriales bacterium]
MFKKIVLILALLVAVLVASLAVYIYTSSVEFTAEEEARIEAAIQLPLQEQVGEVGYAMNDETRIWYDVQTPKDSIRGTLILIMGLSADALAWPNFFIEPLLTAGYQVVRLDNRGVGMSDWDDFDPENPYSLSDMANDVLAVMDTLKLKKAHICGVSLGGMIGQTLCIEHPERTFSLISMMSTPWIMDPELPELNMNCFKQIGINTIRYGLSSDEVNAVKMSLAIRTLLNGSQKYQPNIERIAQLTLYNLRNRNGQNRQSGMQQSAAVEKSGSRIDALKTLQTPTLVIHGKTDPLIPFEHGLKTAALIPNAETLWVDGLGHMIPEVYSDTIVSKMVELMNAASQPKKPLTLE